MSFDSSAFADTLASVRRDLEHIDTAVAWLAPTAYEQRSGGGGGGTVICGTCDGAGRLANGQPCEECVVATIGDVGEIVLRRHHIATQLDGMAKELDRVWDLVKGMTTRVGRMANLIDKGASRLPGMDGPSVDPREVAEQVRRRNERVGRGEEPAPLAPIAKDAAERLAQKIKTQDAIDAAVAKRAKQGERVGNRWRR